MIGYHNTQINGFQGNLITGPLKKVKVGDIITSKQAQYPNYKMVWEKYKSVANELGVYFPYTYGYAYPESKFNELQSGKGANDFGFLSSWNIVQAHDDKVTKGRGNFSLLITLRMFDSPIDNSSAKERIEKQDKDIKERAHKYFTPGSGDLIELISDQWKVISTLEDWFKDHPDKLLRLRNTFYHPHQAEPEHNDILDLMKKHGVID